MIARCDWCGAEVTWWGGNGETWYECAACGWWDVDVELWGMVNEAPSRDQRARPDSPDPGSVRG